MEPDAPLPQIWRRLRRSNRGMLGLSILAIVVLVASAGPWLTPQDPLAQHLLERRRPPSLQHPLGQDELGRDNLSRVVWGARLSLVAGVGATAIGLLLGGMLGVMAGYLRGWPESALMGVMDALISFPALLLALVIMTVVGPGLVSAVVAVGITSAPAFARLARTGVLVTRRQEFVVAAAAGGASERRLLSRHILPAALSPILAQAMLVTGIAILEIAGLGFLGLGAQPPTPEWGAMIAQGRGALFAAPHIVLAPALAIAVAVLGLNLFGDGLRDALDPRIEP